MLCCAAAIQPPKIAKDKTEIRITYLLDYGRKQAIQLQTVIKGRQRLFLNNRKIIKFRRTTRHPNNLPIKMAELKDKNGEPIHERDHVFARSRGGRHEGEVDKIVTTEEEAKEEGVKHPPKVCYFYTYYNSK